MVTRRSVLRGLAAFATAGAGFAGYAFGIEPMWRLRVQRYAFTPPKWPKGLRLRVSIIADLHAGEPYMSLDRIRAIVARANALEPDVHLLLGDYVAGHKWLSRQIPAAEWAAVLARLDAPLGVHAVLGNHDWWDDHAAQRARRGPVVAGQAMAAKGITVYENDATRLTKGGQPFWIAGLGDQLAMISIPGRGERDTAPSAEALRTARSAEAPRTANAGPSQTVRSRMKLTGVDDLPGTLAKITGDAPVILMAHEPDIFPRVPDRVAVTLCGHTHGGQVRLLGYSPIVPSRHGNRYAHGHIVEDGRNLVVSGGLGCSILPVRFGMPPEIVLLELGGGSA